MDEDPKDDNEAKKNKEIKVEDENKEDDASKKKSPNKDKENDQIQDQDEQPFDESKNQILDKYRTEMKKPDKKKLKSKSVNYGDRRASKLNLSNSRA